MKDNNNYCIVEEKDDKQNILGLLLSIELYDSQSTCVIFCSEKTKNFILNFPKSIDLKLDFILTEIPENGNILLFIQNLIKAITYTTKTYGSCIFLLYTLIMTNKLCIPKKIVKQGFGFLKKTHVLHKKEFDYQLYSLEIIYINDLEFIDYFKNQFNTALQCNDILEENITDSKDDEDKKKIIGETFSHAPYNLVKDHNITMFLEKYTSVGTESFHGYDKNIKFDQISKDLYHNKYPICFFKLNLAVPNEGILNLNKRLLSIIAKKNQIYMSIINIKHSNKLLEFVIPNKSSIGIWNRENDFPGLFEIVNMITEKHPNYINKIELFVDYFSLSNFILTDKPSHYWLHNNIRFGTKINICNYDSSLLEALNDSKFPLTSSFLFYYPHSLKSILSFLDSHDSQLKENKRTQMSCCVETDMKNCKFNITCDLDENKSMTNMDYNELLKQLASYNFCNIKKMDMSLIATCLALGVVPIINENETVLDLVKNQHYVNNVTEAGDEWEKLSEHCKDYYNKNMTIDALVDKLINQIFVRDI